MTSEETKMGKPSRTRDLMGAVLLVLVGLLYMSGISSNTIERGATVEDDTATEVLEVSLPATMVTATAWIS